MILSLQHEENREAPSRSLDGHGWNDADNDANLEEDRCIISNHLSSMKKTGKPPAMDMDGMMPPPPPPKKPTKAKKKTKDGGTKKDEGKKKKTEL